jgi:hypothetical protein
MSPNLDRLLCERYPKIFAERHGDPAETAMCWGFAHGDSWFVLIDTLCQALQCETDEGGAPQIVAKQVKSKFGGLRFYVNDKTSNAQRARIRLVESLSTRTCQVCGRLSMEMRKVTLLEARSAQEACICAPDHP